MSAPLRKQIAEMIAAHFELDPAPIVLEPIERLADRVLALLPHEPEPDDEVLRNLDNAIEALRQFTAPDDLVIAAEEYVRNARGAFTRRKP